MGPNKTHVNTQDKILTSPEGSVVEVLNPNGAAPIVLACEHASSFIPKSLAGLGLTDAAAVSHAAWDPGALALSQKISQLLDARLVAARVSRLVYDCNRPPGSPDAMPEKSELIDVPGNVGLSSEVREARAAEFYHPFHELVANTIITTGAIAFVTIHSFTPVFFGVDRAVELGLLHGEDERLAVRMLELSKCVTRLDTRLNEPYGPNDGVTHTLEKHAATAALLNVMIEVRNDLLENQEDIARIAQELALMIQQGIGQCAPEHDNFRKAQV